MKKSVIRALLVVATLALGQQQVRADLFRDVLIGLEFAGVEFSGQRNPLSGGVQVGAARNFNNTLLDFGTTELTLTGPIVASAEIGGRLLPVVDLNFGSPDGSPLQYEMVMNLGLEQVNVSGSMLIDTALSINALGFYDVRYQISNRGDISADGVLLRQDRDIDFDIGPVNASGNVFTDLLAVITEPFYSAVGAENPFTKFSQRANRNGIDEAVDRVRAKVEQNDEFLTEEDIDLLVRAAVTSRLLGTPGPDLSFLENARFADEVLDGQVGLPQNGTNPSSNVIPEPATATLLLASLCLVIRRRR